MRILGNSSAVLLPLFLLCTLSTATRAQSYEYDWGVELMERFRFYDMAETTFTDLSRRGDQKLKLAGELGLGKLFRQQATRSTVVDERQKLNDQALSRFRAVAKGIPTSDIKHFDAQFAIADLLQEVASEGIDQVQRGLVSADQLGDFTKKLANGLNQADAVYSRIEARYGDESDDSSVGYFYGKRAVLNSAILKLRKAEVIAIDPKKIRSTAWESNLSDAREALEIFGDDHLDSILGMHAYMWLGRVLKQFVSAGAGDVTVDDVVAWWDYAFDDLIKTPEETKDWEEGTYIWEPRPESWQRLGERIAWWKLEFLVEQGQNAAAVESGNNFRAKWKACKYEYSQFGRMALVELARAMQRSGDGGGALKLTTLISEGARDYPKRLADQLTSVIIKTSTSSADFPISVLAAGANGAFQSGRSGEDAAQKNHECLALYHAVIESLSKIEDPANRNDLGALAWFRVGTCYYRLGRLPEAAIAFEYGYKNFNTGRFKENPKIIKEMGDSWLFIVKKQSRAQPNSKFARSQETGATNWIIDNPAKGVAVSTVDLEWGQAMAAYTKKDYAGALKGFEVLASRNSSRQESAMVKVALCKIKLVGASKTSTIADWKGVAKLLVDYEAYTETNSVSDPDEVAARKRALERALFYRIQCSNSIAKLITDKAAKRPTQEKILSLSSRFLDRSRDKNLLIYALSYRFSALDALGRVDELEACYKRMVAVDSENGLTLGKALIVANRLRTSAVGMSSETSEARAAQNVVFRRAGTYYKGWLLWKKPRAFKSWSLVYNIYYDLEDWKTANEIIELVLQRFENTEGTASKNVYLARRKQARCTLELAKAAYAEEDKVSAEKLFSIASKQYDVLLNDADSPVRKSLAIAEEAAEIFGGSLVGPNRRGLYSFYPGNAQFLKAQENWHRVYKTLRVQVATTPVEQRHLDNRVWKARFYTFLMAYQIAHAAGDTKGIRKLKGSLKSLQAKNNGKPGGEKYAEPFKWLWSKVR